MYDDIGTRMKTYYEQIPKINLMRRMMESHFILSQKVLKNPLILL